MERGGFFPLKKIAEQEDKLVILEQRQAWYNNFVRFPVWGLARENIM